MQFETASEPTPDRLPGYFHWLDGVRGLAALGVVVYHFRHFFIVGEFTWAKIPALDRLPLSQILWPLYDHGASAVQLFWMISGFVFTHVYLRRPTTLRQFTGARFARLYPLHFATLVFMGVLQALSWWSLGYWQIYGGNDVRHFLAQLFMASHWTNAVVGQSFNGPVWSVSVEVLIYFLFFLSLRLLRRHGVLAAVSMSAGMFAVRLLWSDSLPLLNSSVIGCGAFFFFGSAIYVALPYLLTRPRWTAVLAAIAGTVGLMAFRADVQPLGKAGLGAAVLLGVALLDCLCPLQARPGPHPIRRVVMTLGDASYSIYLVHIPLQLTLLLMSDLVLGPERPYAGNPLTLALYVGATVALAVWIHHHFERPAGARLRRMYHVPPKPRAQIV